MVHKSPTALSLTPERIWHIQDSQGTYKTVSSLFAGHLVEDHREDSEVAERDEDGAEEPHRLVAEARNVVCDPLLRGGCEARSY